jgi:hypothetical protein
VSFAGEQIAEIQQLYKKLFCKSEETGGGVHLLVGEDATYSDLARSVFGLSRIIPFCQSTTYAPEVWKQIATYKCLYSGSAVIFWRFYVFV